MICSHLQKINKRKMKIKSIKNTSTCCPSQWEGITESNEVIYIRYRWGRLAIQLSEPNGTITDAVNTGRVLYNKQIGAIYAGVITLEAVLEIMKKELIISEV
jgi:hypothetical protein